MSLDRATLLCCALLATLPSSVLAQEAAPYFGSPASWATEARPDLVVELGLGAALAPAYIGSQDVALTFDPLIDVERLLIPGLLDHDRLNGGAGLSFSPSFRIQSARKASDHDELTGLDDIDTTVELGGKVGYRMLLNEFTDAELYGSLRYGVGGASGFVGDVGVELGTQVHPQLKIVSRASATLADSDYQGTYFGVSAEEELASGGAYESFDPDGGIQSVQLSLGAKYEFVPDTFLNLTGQYQRLVGDAAASPIVRDHGEHQYRLSLGISRKFSINY